jgi:cellobiose transport system permease protein
MRTTTTGVTLGRRTGAHPRTGPRDFGRYLPIYLAIAPFYLLFAVFGLFPIAFSLYLSFQKWDGIGAMTGVGLSQYHYLVTDSFFWQSLVNTLEIWIISTIPMLFLALVVAFLLNSPLRFTTFYRVAYFIPNVTSIVAIAIIFGSVFGNSSGLLNALLSALHLPTVAWLTTPWGIKIAIASMVIWQWTGYNAIIYVAGLQSIPGDLYEAARMDGASTPNIFFRITIPLLRPIILFTVITSTIGGMQIFTQPQILLGNTGTTGGPGNAGLTMVLYLYHVAFEQNQFGYGAAVAWGLFIIIVLFSALNWRIVQGAGTAELR